MMPDHASYCNRATKGQTAHRNGHNRALVHAKGGQLELIAIQLVQIDEHDVTYDKDVI